MCCISTRFIDNFMQLATVADLIERVSEKRTLSLSSLAVMTLPIIVEEPLDFPLLKQMFLSRTDLAGAERGVTPPPNISVFFSKFCFHSVEIIFC